jgi:hypothetical protein
MLLHRRSILFSPSGIIQDTVQSVKRLGTLHCTIMSTGTRAPLQPNGLLFDIDKVNPSQVCYGAEAILSSSSASDAAGGSSAGGGGATSDHAHMFAVFGALMVAQSQFASASHCYLSVCETLSVRPNATVMRSCATADSASGDSAAELSIQLGAAYLGVKGTIAFIVTLPHLAHVLSELDLCNGHVDSSLCSMLCHSLLKATRLRTLRLSRNPLGSIGADCVARLASWRPSLRTVEMEQVAMTAAVRRRIEAAVERNASVGTIPSSRHEGGALYVPDAVVS